MKLLKFYSPSCAPCKAITPFVNSVAFELQLAVEAIDATQNPEMASKYGIRAVPTLVLAGEGGEHITSKTGVMTEEAMSAWLEEYV